MTSHAFRKGSVLIACTILLVIFTTLAVAMATMSGTNLQIADNQRKANMAFASAESGLEVVRYWVDRIRMPSSISVQDYLSTAISNLQTELAANGIGNFRINSDGSIPTVVVHALAGQSFEGQISVDPADPAMLRLLIIGNCHGAARTLRVNFRIKPYRFPIFNYGMATKGPLVLPGNPRFQAATQGWEADVYVESANSLIAVDIGGNSTFAGDIDIGNPQASVSSGGALNLGGEIRTLQEEDRPEFPVPDVQHFRRYATGSVIGPETDLSGSSVTLTNAVIAAGTNPKFPGNVGIDGILYVEAPNIVTFSRNTTLQGMIVAEGDVNDPGTNQINFGDPTTPSVPSNFSSGPYPPGAEFDALRNEVGSCVLAPGFAVSFWKNFSAINGVIAASGLHFDKNASARVEGTLINYSQQPTDVNGNINMTFDRSAMVEIPAGFDLLRVLTYVPQSYTIVF
jgi:hypothetical protein